MSKVLFFIVVPAVQLCDIVRQSCCVAHCKYCKTTAQNPEIFCHGEVYGFHKADVKQV